MKLKEAYETRMQAHKAMTSEGWTPTKAGSYVRERNEYGTVYQSPVTKQWQIKRGWA